MSGYDEQVREVLLSNIEMIEGVGTDGGAERARKHFAAWVQVLKSDQPLPRDLQRGLAGLFEFLARGILPGPISDCVGPGAAANPSEERDRKIAVAYVLAAKRGVIADQSPIKTIVKAFGLKSRNSVQEWVAKYSASLAERDLSDPDRISDHMRNAGVRYSEAGRSQAAITAKVKRKKMPV